MAKSTAEKPISANSPSAKMKTLTINFADGNKGGVGKSLLARTLYQYFLDKGLDTIGVEADTNSPDFKGIYRSATVSRFSEDENMNGQANNIINLAIDEHKSLVVNLPATVHGAFKLWLDSYDIVNLAQEHDMKLVKWFICTGEFDSMKSLMVSLQKFGETIPHVVVRNLKYAEWDYFDEDETTQALIKQYQCKVMDLPKLPLRVASTLLQKRLTFSDALVYKSDRYGVAEQSAIKAYLRNAYSGFQSTGFVPL